MGSNTNGRTQPLILTLRSEQAALELLECSRLLRRCADNYVKQNIFFNKDLTPAAAFAAYQVRAARREKTAVAATGVKGIRLIEINHQYRSGNPEREEESDVGLANRRRDMPGGDIQHGEHISEIRMAQSPPPSSSTVPLPEQANSSRASAHSADNNVHDTNVTKASSSFNRCITENGTMQFSL